MFNFGISTVTGMGLSGIRGFIFYLMHVLPMYFFFFFLLQPIHSNRRVTMTVLQAKSPASSLGGIDFR